MGTGQLGETSSKNRSVGVKENTKLELKKELMDYFEVLNIRTGMKFAFPHGKY